MRDDAIAHEAEMLAAREAATRHLREYEATPAHLMRGALKAMHLRLWLKFDRAAQEAQRKMEEAR